VSNFGNASDLERKRKKQADNKAFLEQPVILVQMFFSKISSRHSSLSLSSLTLQYLKGVFSNGGKEESRQAVIILPPVEFLRRGLCSIPEWLSYGLRSFSALGVPILWGDASSPLDEKLTVKSLL